MRFYLLAICLLTGFQLVGQTSFKTIYGSSRPEEARSVIQTLDGGYAIAGSTLAHSDKNFALLKIDSLGDTLWSREYDAGGIECVLDLYQMNDSGYIMIGTWDGMLSNYERCVYVVRTNGQGDVVWSNLYKGPYYTKCRGGFVTSDEYILVCGMADSTSILDEKPFIMKIDPNGSMVWMKRYHPGQYPQFYYFDQITELLDGSYVCSGVTPNNGFNALLFVTDTAGYCLWGTLLASTGNVGINDLKVTTTGEIVASGMWSTTQEFGFFVMLADAGGVVQWMNVYTDSTAWPGNTAISVLSNDDILVAGSKTFFPEGGYVVRLTSAGNIVNAFMNDTNIASHYLDCIESRNGGSVLLGQYYGAHTANDSGSFYLVKTRVDGTTNCGDVAMPLNLMATTPTSSSFTAAFVEGGSQQTVSTTEQSGCSIILLCGTEVGESVVDESVRLYPNPADDVVNLEISSNESCRFVLFNSLGQIVCDATVDHTMTSISLHEIITGVYFFQVESKLGIISSGKLIKQ